MARKRQKGVVARENKHSDSFAPLPRVEEDKLYDWLAKKTNPLVLILDGVEDPHNLGACMRSADAAGVAAVIAPKHKAVSVTDTVRRVAAGGAEHVPFVQVGNLVRTMQQLQEIGFWLVGTSDAATQSLYEVDMKGPIGMVLGAEAKGVRRLTAETCDYLVKIPMLGHVDCLNVSVATGVCLFEVVRQRQMTS